ncbi:MAG: biotin-dependent carboxyltransferase family protein [Clostridiales bacterium]|nr:biotin-dependent carboxyltransferase family protein [Clostridiales bacterium]MDY5515038.1 biotin-dependent carboxyltransferase family protein [Candidatus Ventricola sp.]
MIEVITPGALTTVQDVGRAGHAAEGFPECGACDKYAMALANLLCGNTDCLHTAVLEMTLMGATLRAQTPVIAALTGAQAAPTLNGQSVPMNWPFLMKEGDVLEIGAFTGGLRGYLAVSGGFDVPAVLNSRATDVKTHIGGLEGRALRAGDMLPVGQGDASARRLAALSRGAEAIAQKPWLLRPSTPQGFLGDAVMPLLRAVPGPQDDAFTAEGLHTFTHGVYTVSSDSGRMAARLSGPAVASVRGSDILSDGIVEGSVQISANGQPIVMLADHQTTGGYAKIATVLPCDLPVLAQTRPGAPVAFRFVTPAGGMQALRLERSKWSYMKEQMP